MKGIPLSRFSSVVQTVRPNRVEAVLAILGPVNQRLFREGVDRDRVQIPRDKLGKFAREAAKIFPVEPQGDLRHQHSWESRRELIRFPKRLNTHR